MINYKIRNSSNISFPKLIHFIYIETNHDELDDKYKQNIDSFYKIYIETTGWEINIWTNNSIDKHFCKNDSKICDILHNNTYSLLIKTDILKYVIMYRFGGVYFDLNFVAVVDIEKLINKNIAKHGLIVCNEISGESLFLSSHFFAAYPQNKCVKTAKINIINNIEMLHEYDFERLCLWKRSILATYYQNLMLLNISHYIDSLLRNFDLNQIATELPTKYMYSLNNNNNNNNNVNESSDLYAIYLTTDSKETKDMDFNNLLKTDYYPFNKEWYFNYFEGDKPFNYIEKLRYPLAKYKSIEGFKYKFETYPFYNPSIIRIDNIKNYKKEFMYPFIFSDQNINIINKTMYIISGRWVNNQCRESHFYSPYNNNNNIHVNYNNVDNERTGSGLILFDKNWNILSYISIQLSQDNNIWYLDNQHFIDIEDCRLFVYVSIVFINCGTYVDTARFDYIPRNYIGAILWKEENNNIMIAYLESKINIKLNSNMFKTKRLYHTPNNYTFGMQPKNLIPLSYNQSLYFQWELTHSYWIEIKANELNNNNGMIHGTYAFHNKKPFKSADHVNINNPVEIIHASYHLNNGFIHVFKTNEYIGIGHTHYDLYDGVSQTPYHIRPYNIQHGHHYTHFFYTIEDKPPFKIKRISHQFCFVSTQIQFNNSFSNMTIYDCEIIQFVTGMVENTINNIQYLYITYGINDCISSIAQVEKNIVLNMLKSVTY